MQKSLPADQEILGSIPGSSVGFFSAVGNFHDIYGLGVCVSECFVYVLSFVIFEEGYNLHDTICDPWIIPPLQEIGL